MTTLSNSIVRIKVDCLSFDAPKDCTREQLVQFWRCNDLKFQLGMFNGSNIIDPTNFDTLYFSVRALKDGKIPSGGDNALMFSSTTKFDSTLSAETWEDCTKQHAEISFSTDENSLPSGEYWLSVWVKTAEGNIITLTSGICKILENGGISTIPPDPISSYYTASECDEKFQPIGSSGDVSSCLLKSNNLSDLGDASLARQNLKLGNMAEQESSNISITGGSINGITALPISCGGTGTIAKLAAFNGLSPANVKGDLLTCDGINNTKLGIGTQNQILTVDPTSSNGIKWATHPWNFIIEKTITEETAELLFEDIFDADQFKHYCLQFHSLKLSVGPSRLLMNFGVTDENSTTWLTTEADHVYNTFDQYGSVSKFATSIGTHSFFGWGNDNTTYQCYDGVTNGSMEIWNTGSSSSMVQARAESCSYRVIDGALTPINGVYQFIHKNSAGNVINSLKFYAETGSLQEGSFVVYGIR